MMKVLEQSRYEFPLLNMRNFLPCQTFPRPIQLFISRPTLDNHLTSHFFAATTTASTRLNTFITIRGHLL